VVSCAFEHFEGRRGYGCAFELCGRGGFASKLLRAAWFVRLANFEGGVGVISVPPSNFEGGVVSCAFDF